MRDHINVFETGEDICIQAGPVEVSVEKDAAPELARELQSMVPFASMKMTDQQAAEFQEAVNEFERRAGEVQ